jgi:ribonuclease HI
LTDLDFADDLVLITSGDKELFERAQKSLERVEQEAKQVNLSINVGKEKSAYMLFNTPTKGSLKMSDGVELPQVQEYKYLGRVVYCKSEVKKDQKFAWTKRVTSAWGAMHKCQTIWKSKTFSKQQKEKLFMTLVQSVLCFGSASWNEATVGDWESLDRIFTNMRCMALGIRRYEDGRNKSLREIYGDSLKLSQCVKVKSVTLLGHMVRRPMIPWTQFTAHTFDIPLGREKTLSSRVVENFGLDFEAMCSIAQDRGKWSEEVVTYKMKLLSRPTFVSFNQRNWKSTYAACLLHEDFQFIEEGKETFPFWDGYVHAYTDGSAQQEGDSTSAGYGIVYRMKHWTLPLTFPRHFFAALRDGASNNRAEIQAVIDAVIQSAGFRLVIHTDSALVWNWMHWGREAHRQYRYKGANSDLWLKLDEVCRLHGSKILCIKVRAHIGNRWNELADQLANWGRELAQSGVLAQ